MKWKDVKGYEGLYQVSENGEVRSMDRMQKGRYGQVLHHGSVLWQGRNKDGYHIVTFNVDKKKVVKKVHRLVYEAFVGELVDGFVIDHIDNNKDNNAVSNLQQVTNRVNTTKDRHSDLPPCIFHNRNRYAVSVFYGGHSKYIGVFDTIDEAIEARDYVFEQISKSETPKRIVRRNTFKNGYKICPCCGEEKPITEYYKNKYARLSRTMQGLPSPTCN